MAAYLEGTFTDLRVALFSVIKYPYKEKSTMIREVLKAAAMKIQV